MKKFRFVLAIAALSVLCGCNKGSDNAGHEESVDNVNTETAVAEGNVIQLDTDDFLTKVVNYRTGKVSTWNYLGDKPAVVDFYADWCGPCRMMAPLLKEAAKKYAGQVYIYKVDVDKEGEIASSFGIQGIPTIMFIPMGRDPEVVVGAIDKVELFNKIDNILK